MFCENAKIRGAGLSFAKFTKIRKFINCPSHWKFSKASIFSAQTATFAKNPGKFLSAFDVQKMSKFNTNLKINKLFDAFVIF